MLQRRHGGGRRGIGAGLEGLGDDALDGGRHAVGDPPGGEEGGHLPRVDVLDEGIGKDLRQVVADLQPHLAPLRVDHQQHPAGGPHQALPAVLFEQLAGGGGEIGAGRVEDHQVEMEIDLLQQPAVQGDQLPGRGRGQQSGAIVDEGRSGSGHGHSRTGPAAPAPPTAGLRQFLMVAPSSQAPSASSRESCGQ